MSDKNRLDLIIEGNTCVWNIRDEGSINGTYIGQFRFRCFLTPTQRLAAGREYRELLGANPTLALEHESNLAYSLTQLKQRVISSPPFWSSAVGDHGLQGDLPDINIVEAVLDAAISAELKFQKQLEKAKKSALEKAKEAAEKLISQRDEDDVDEDSEEKQ